MHAQCPHCQAIFRVTVRDLIAAKGMVRCSQCGGVFNAQQTLVSPPPPPKIETPPAPESDPAALTLSAGDHQPHWASPAWLETALTPPEPTHSNPRTRRLLSVGIAVLALALVGQFAWHDHERLARQTWLGLPFIALCGLLGCEAPAGRDTGRIEITERSVAAHPDVADALLITATLANRAPYAQPYPLLQIALTDLQGNVTALRRFRPEEYLTEPPAPLMAPGEPVGVRLEVADPGRETVAFEFKFF